VVGGGRVALRKVQVLLEHGARVEVVSLKLCTELIQLNATKAISVLYKKYEPGDLKDAFVVIAATTEADTNQKVANEARQQGILINVVDSSKYSDFIVPSRFCCGNLTIAVSTAGRSPALARKIRTKLEKDIGNDYASLLVLIEEVRSELKKRAVKVSGDDWQKALDLDVLVELLRTGQREKAKAILLGNLEIPK